MADLDDFFAKKDRKKGKSSKKFSTTDEVAKKLEDTAKKQAEVQQVKKPKERAPEEGEDPEAQEQDEWKDFEEEKKDYSGLKIGNLTIGPNGEQGQTGSSGEAGSGEPSEGSEQNADGEKKPAGPWKRIEDSAPQPIPEPVRQPPVVDSPNVKGGFYVPPSKRSERPTSQSQPPSRLRNRGGAAPDIHNEDFFPTLSKSGENKKNRNEGSFEVVQSNRASSYRNQQAEQNKMTGGPKLSLGNRFNTLSNDS